MLGRPAGRPSKNIHMTKVLIATEKPFAPVAVTGIREVVEEAGYELVLLENYTSKDELIKTVSDVDAMIIRSDKADKDVIETVSIQVAHASDRVASPVVHCDARDDEVHIGQGQVGGRGIQ